jgi:hypothetical protein
MTKKRTLIDLFKKKSPDTTDSHTTHIDTPPTSDSAINTNTPTPSEQPQASSSRDVGHTFDFDDEETQVAIEASLEPNTKPSAFKVLSKRMSRFFTKTLPKKSRPLSDQSYAQPIPSIKKSKDLDDTIKSDTRRFFVYSGVPHTPPDTGYHTKEQSTADSITIQSPLGLRKAALNQPHQRTNTLPLNPAIHSITKGLDRLSSTETIKLFSQESIDNPSSINNYSQENRKLQLDGGMKKKDGKTRILITINSGMIIITWMYRYVSYFLSPNKKSSNPVGYEEKMASRRCRGQNYR